MDSNVILHSPIAILCAPSHPAFALRCHKLHNSEGVDVELKLSWIQLPAHLSGNCKACDEFNSSCCPSPCGVEDHKCSANTLAINANLDLGPPYYFQWFGSLAKPFCTFLVFGESPYSNPNRNTLVRTGKAGVQLLFFAMFLYTLCVEFVQVAHVNLVSNSSWIAYNGCVAVFGTSSNIASCLSGFSLWLSRGLTKTWVDAHAQIRQQEPPAPNTSVLKAAYLGTMCAYLCIMMILCVVHIVIALIFAWIWLFALIIQVAFASCLTQALVKLKRKTELSEQVELLQVGEDLTVEEMEQVLRMANERASSDSDQIKALYEKNVSTFQQVGLSQFGFILYFVTSVMSPLIVFLAPIVTRYVTEGDYLGSITKTFWERHLGTYIAVTLSGLGPMTAFTWWLL